MDTKKRSANRYRRGLAWALSFGLLAGSLLPFPRPVGASPVEEGFLEEIPGGEELPETYSEGEGFSVGEPQQEEGKAGFEAVRPEGEFLSEIGEQNTVLSGVGGERETTQEVILTVTVDNNNENAVKTAVEAALANSGSQIDSTSVTTLKITGGAKDITGDNWEYLWMLYQDDDWGSLTTLDLEDMKALTTVGGFLVPLRIEEIPRLKKVILPESLTTLDTNAFRICTGLVNINLPASLKIIKGTVFYGCRSLQTVNLPDGLTKIDMNAFGGCTGLTTVTLPDGLTTIGDNAFGGCIGLKEITLPQSLTTLGEMPFNGCTSLKAIHVAKENTKFQSEKGVLYNAGKDTLLYYPEGKTENSFIVPEGVKTIGQSAFLECKNLEALVLPASVEMIGASAFWNCSSLISLTFLGSQAPTIGNGVFNNISSNGILQYPPGADYSSITSGLPLEWQKEAGLRVTVADDSVNAVETAVEQALANSGSPIAPASVTTLKITGGAKDITGNNWEYLWMLYQDADWGSLTTLDLGEMKNLKKVGGFSLMGDSGESGRLTKVILPDNLTTLDGNAFVACTGLVDINFPASLTTIALNAFSGCVSLTAVNLPDRLTTIGDNAFGGCTKLETITLPASLTTLGIGAFENCTGLKAIEVKTGNLSFISEGGVLYNADEVEKKLLLYPAGKEGTLFTVPADVKIIGNLAFSGCKNLGAVVLPAGVKMIEYDAFLNCTGLKNVTWQEPVSGEALSEMTIESWAFGGCSSLEEITLPVNLKSFNPGIVQGCTSLQAIHAADGHRAFQSFDGVLYNAEKDTLLCYPQGKNGNSFHVPEGVKTIGSSAFMECSKLTAVTLPPGLKTIGSSAFNGCSKLAAVTLPPGVETIGSSAFSGCSELAAVTLLAGVETIGSYAFSGCSGLAAVTLPAGLKTIEYNAFSGCSGLAALTLPASVNRIWQFAFEGCRSLTSLTFLGSEAPEIEESSFEGEFPAKGTLRYPAGADYSTIINNLPEGWTAVEVRPPSPVYYYTVRFDSQGGSPVEPMSSVREYTVITPPEAPVREGYVFAGWYRDGEGTVPWDFTKDWVTGNLTLYAGWRLKAPEGVTAALKSRSAKALTFTWTAAADGEGYTVRYRKQGEKEYEEAAVCEGRENTFYTLRNLDPGCSYYMTVSPWKKEADGTLLYGPSSRAVRGTTKPEAAVIRKVAVSKEGNLKVYLEGAAQGATHYAMCYSRSRDFTPYRIGIRTRYTTRTLAKRLPKGTYYVKVRTYVQLGSSRVYGDWSAKAVKVTVR